MKLGLTRLNIVVVAGSQKMGVQVRNRLLFRPELPWFWGSIILEKYLSHYSKLIQTMRSWKSSYFSSYKCLIRRTKIGVVTQLLCGIMPVITQNKRLSACSKRWKFHYYHLVVIVTTWLQLSSSLQDLKLQIYTLAKWKLAKSRCAFFLWPCLEILII